jgi:outer membrane receptor protein involved in Fe transport
VTQPNSNYSQTETARVALKWKVSDALEVMPSIFYQRLQINDTAAYWETLSNAGANVFRNGNAGTNPSNDPFTLSAIRIKWDLGFASLFSNTSYYNRNQTGTSDYTQYLRATWSSFPAVLADGITPASPNGYQLPNTFPQAGDNGYSRFHDNQRNFYQELRLSSNDTNARLLWTGGAYYSHLSENVIEFIVDPTINQEIINWTGGNNSLCFPGQDCPGGLIANTPTQIETDKQIAAFGEVTYKLTDTFKVTGGLRFSKLNYDLRVWEDGPFIGYTVNSYAKGSDNPITPKAVLSWQPDHDNLVYISGSKGFRPGGLNVPVGDICSPSLGALGINQVPGQYGSDNLWSYEIGSKNQFFDHTLEINASLYFIDWNQIQQNVYLPSCGEQFTANLGKAKSKGGDFEVIYRPIPALTLDLTAAYTDARLTNSSCAGALVYNIASSACVAPGATGVPISRPIASSGDALLGAPWAFTAAAEYHFVEWDGRLPYFRVDYQHQNAQKNLFPIQDANNALIDTTLRGPPVLNNLSLRAGVRFNGLDLSAYANNVTNSNPLLFNERDIYPYAGPPGTGTSQLGPTTENLYFGRGVRPRTIGLTATYRY